MKHRDFGLNGNCDCLCTTLLNKGCLLETRQIDKVQMLNSTEMGFSGRDCPLGTMVHKTTYKVPGYNQE